MKRLLIGLLIVIISLAMFVSCDSDDDDDDDNVVGVTQPPTTDWRYAITTSQSPDARYGYIYIYALDTTDIIETCTLTIDGEEIAIYYQEMYNEWWADFEFTQGQSYTYSLNINDGAYSESATLTMPYTPVITYDESWDGQTNCELTWTLEASSEAQSLFILGPDDEERSIGSIYIEPALRAYTFAAGLHGYNDPETEYFSFSVDEENWRIVGDLVFLSFTYDAGSCGTLSRDVQDHHSFARSLGHHIVSQIR